MNTGSNSGPVADERQTVFEDLAKQLYQSPSKGSALMKGVLNIKPEVKLSEVDRFKDYWMKKKTQAPTYPQLWQFETWLFSQEDRVVVHKHSCFFDICEGQGYIEIYDRKLGAEYIGSDYTFAKWCACAVGESEHRRLLKTHCYTLPQRAIISRNRGKEQLVQSPITDGKLRSIGSE